MSGREIGICQSSKLPDIEDELVLTISNTAVVTSVEAIVSTLNDGASLVAEILKEWSHCLLYTSPSPRD